MHAVENFIPLTGDINQGLDVLNSLFGKILYSKLPVGQEWLDHLDILNAVANSTSKCNSRLKIRLLSEVRQKPPVAV